MRPAPIGKSLRFNSSRHFVTRAFPETLPEILFAPKNPLYIIPSALPASGKTTLLRIYTAYMRSRGYAVAMISRDEVIFDRMDWVNAHNLGKKGYPLSYADMHPENHKDQNGNIIDPEKYAASCKAMKMVLEVLAGKERDARTQLLIKPNVIVIHDDLNLTQQRRLELLDGSSVGKIDQKVGLVPDNVIEIGRGITHSTSIVALAMPIGADLRNQFQDVRERCGGHRVPQPVMDLLYGIYEPPSEEESRITQVIRNGSSCEDLTCAMAKMIGFKDAKELVEFLNVQKEPEITKKFVVEHGPLEIPGNRQFCNQIKNDILDEFMKRLLSSQEREKIDLSEKGKLYDDVVKEISSRGRMTSMSCLS